MFFPSWECELKRLNRQSERGAAAVEFAIVVPLVILLCAGSVAIGNAWRTNIRMESVAHEAARLCGVRPAAEQGTCLEALVSVATVSGNCQQLTPTISSSTEETFAGTSVLVSKVTVTCQYSLMPGISGVPPLILETSVEGLAN